MITIEKPGSPAELAHHGVKGQKWGVRRARAASRREAFNRQNPSKRKRDAAIERARVETKFGNPSKAERAASLRLTSGEKTVLGILAISGIGTLPIAAIVTGRVAVRRHIEKS